MSVPADRGGAAQGHVQLLENELEALFRISRLLSRPWEQETLPALLQALHQPGGMQKGLLLRVAGDDGALHVSAVHGRDPQALGGIVYSPGEGLVGSVLTRRRALIVPRLADEPRFLNRLKLYDPELPFIGVPIDRGEQDPAGVLAAQPVRCDPWLEEHARFLAMVAHLLAPILGPVWSRERARRDFALDRDSLCRAVREEYGFDNIIGRSRPMRRVFEQVRQVAKWHTTVLLRGESGTGKELIANAIHYNSPRANGPFVKLNCAALPDTLLESELFGHEKGAFTGALSQRQGRFEQAHGGTLFLDEIGDVSPAFQAKLLRVLQEGELERVGGSRTLRVEVRIIAATNRDLETAVEAGEFREDLYYRLNVMPIVMPPLRQRPEDIAELARFLLANIARRQGRSLTLTESAVQRLLRHGWPGNVRELENCLERSAVMSQAGVIDQDLIELGGLDGMMVPPGADTIDLDNPDLDERERVIAALEQAGWVQAKAARLLGMTPR